MSLQSELTRLQANVAGVSSSKDDIMAALASKGVTVPSGATLHDVPRLIGQIDGMAPQPDPYTRIVHNDMDGKDYTIQNINGTWWATTNYKDYCQFSEVANIQAPWRVPSRKDFQDLIDSFAVEEVTEPGYWNSYVKPYPTNTTGLSFRGLGYKETESGSIQSLEMLGSWWQNINSGDINTFVLRLYQNMWKPSDCGWDVYSSAGFMTVTMYCQLRLIYEP